MNPGQFRPVLLTQWYKAPPEAIFDAWIKPEIIRKWLFTGPDSEIIHVEQDLQPYGSFSILELDHKTGKYIDHFGTYLKIERPYRLMFTLEVPAHFEGVSKVSIDLRKADNGYDLSFMQTGVAPELTESNWEEMLEKLKKVVE